MAQSIETYINNNKSDVKKWLTSLFGKYVSEYYKKAEPSKRLVNLRDVCSDSRRTEKVLEVFNHYDLLEVSIPIYAPRDWRGRLQSHWDKDTYNVRIDHESFLKIAPEYAVPFDFKIEAPKKSTDRIDGYPTIDNISYEGRIHIFFNEEEYTIIDRNETYKKVNRYHSTEETHRVIRVFPKTLESSAERSVFERTLRNYYSKKIPEVTKLMFGFEPETLTHDHDYFSKKLKDYDPSRTNEFEKLGHFKPEFVQEQITKTKKALKYYQATLRDLEKVQEGLKQYKGFEHALIKKGEEYFSKNAPLMINDEDEDTQKVVKLVLRGSNKGLS